MSSPIFYTDSGTGNFVSKVQQWSMMPAAQQLWQTSDIIQALDDEYVNSVIPMIKGINEEYFVEDYDTQITGSWNGQIAIPPDAIGLDLRDVWAISGNPNQAGSQFVECRRFNPNSFNPTYFSIYPTIFGPAYYIQNNILFFSFNSSTQNLSNWGYNYVRTRYFKKPNHLTSRANCAIVTAVNGTSITVDGSNTNASFYSGQALDFLQPQVPFPFDSTDITISNVVVNPGIQTTFTVPSGTTVAVGDIVCPQGFAPVFQYVPEEVYNVVCQYVVVRILDAQGDTEGFQRASAKLQQYFKDCQDLLTPKVFDAPKKIVTNYGIFDCNRASGGMYVTRN